MTKRKHNAYSLWLKYKGTGWERTFTVWDTGHRLYNPRDICRKYYEQNIANCYWVKKHMQILPVARVPKGKIHHE